MRFMVMIKANQDTEAGVMPSEEVLAAMGQYNEELVNAGVMLGGEGFQSARSIHCDHQHFAHPAVPAGANKRHRRFALHITELNPSPSLAH